MRRALRRFGGFWGLGIALALWGTPEAMLAAEGDRYEDDDTRTRAAVIWSIDPATLYADTPSSLADEEIPQVHNIHHAQDEDWLVFYAAGDEWHEVRVQPVAPQLDLKIELYDEHGELLRESDWNRAGESEILDHYLEGETRRLWVRILAMDYEDSGTPQTYRISVYLPYLEFDGIITGYVRDAASGAPMAGARIDSERGMSVATRPSGAYLMPHVAGSFQFTASASWDGYDMQSERVDITALKYTENNFLLNPSDIGNGTTSISGAVRLGNGTPVCAMVLANGQHTFSCDGNGTYALNVPLDAAGQITLFTFADGLAPYRTTASPEAFPFDVQMQPAAPGSPIIDLTSNVECAGTPNWARVTGAVESSNGTALCALVLANGKKLFSCGASLGRYDLSVPLDGEGNITVFGFVDGFQPQKQIMNAAACQQ